jgi:hypothetical protein
MRYKWSLTVSGFTCKQACQNNWSRNLVETFLPSATHRSPSVWRSPCRVKLQSRSIQAVPYQVARSLQSNAEAIFSTVPCCTSPASRSPTFAIHNTKSSNTLIGVPRVDKVTSPVELEPRYNQPSGHYCDCTTRCRPQHSYGFEGGYRSKSRPEL